MKRESRDINFAEDANFPKFNKLGNIGLVVKALDSQSRGPVDSAFYPFEVDKMSIRNFRELSGKK